VGTDNRQHAEGQQLSDDTHNALDVRENSIVVICVGFSVVITIIINIVNGEQLFEKFCIFIEPEV
jgi:hypothetical protein